LAIKALLDKSEYKTETLIGEEATQANIRAKLSALNKKGNTKGVVLLGFFGHGVEFESTKEAMYIPFDASRRLAKDADGKQLFASDGTKLDEPDPATLVGMSELLDALRLCKAGNKLLLADCCRNNPNAARSTRAFGSSVKLSDLPRNSAAVFACSEGEEAHEDDDWQHGALTKCFLDLVPELNEESGDVGTIVGKLRKRVDELVSKSTNGARHQTVHPITNGVVELQLSFSHSGTKASKIMPSHQQLPEIHETILPNLRLKRIPAGKFMMGTTESEIEAVLRWDPKMQKSFFTNGLPQHEVTLSRDFYLGMHEVTRGQFGEFVRRTGYVTECEKDGKGGWGFDRDGEYTQSLDFDWRSVDSRQNGFVQDDSHPVVNVSWNDAVAFCQWLSEESRRQGTLGLGEGYRLPTEAEWEYSARANSKGCYFHGDDPEGLVKYANVADKSFSKSFNSEYRLVSGDDGFVFTSPVGSYRANAFGLFDMHGNVWEWCSDWYGRYDAGSVVDPKGPAMGSDRVLRGGSWSYVAAICVSAFRCWITPDLRSYDGGFRLALSSSGIPQQAEPNK